MVDFNNYFYLDPATFIFEDPEKYLLYNSESGHRIIVEKNDNIDFLFHEFQNIDNLYCINLSNIQIKKDTMSLINTIRDKYMGDIFIGKLPPVVTPPIFKCHANKPKNDLLYSDGSSLMPLLNSITFYLNGTCEQKCPYCSKYYKQFDYCHKSNNQISLEKIKLKIEHGISTSSISLNFIGGNIFLYNDFVLLQKYLDDKKLTSNFFFNYLNWEEAYKECLYYKYFYYNILVHFPLDEYKLNSLINSIKSSINMVHFIFIITSEEEYLLAENIISKNKLQWKSIKPFYNGNNISFFQQNVYLNVIELAEECPNKFDLYKRQQINIYDFGKLRIDSSGNVFANVNHPPIGNLKENLPQIINRELQTGKSWKRTRDQEPCNKCIYQYICPSPSNYEIIIGKHNLCNIKP